MKCLPCRVSPRNRPYGFWYYFGIGVNPEADAWLVPSPSASGSRLRSRQLTGMELYNVGGFVTKLSQNTLIFFLGCMTSSIIKKLKYHNVICQAIFFLDLLPKINFYRDILIKKWALNKNCHSFLRHYAGDWNKMHVHQEKLKLFLIVKWILSRENDCLKRSK